MPHKNWAVGEEVIATDFNPIVADQVVAQFPNAANRAANWLDPPVGAVSHLADSPNTLWIYTAGAWVPYGALGTLAYLERTTDQTGIVNTVVDVGGLITASLVIPAGRRTEVACELMFSKAPADTAGAASVSITDNGGSTVYITRLEYVLSSQFVTVHASRVLSLAAGTYVFKVRAASTTAAFVNVSGSPTFPAWLRVMDVGPA